MAHTIERVILHAIDEIDEEFVAYRASEAGRMKVVLLNVLVGVVVARIAFVIVDRRRMHIDRVQLNKVFAISATLQKNKMNENIAKSDHQSNRLTMSRNLFLKHIPMSNAVELRSCTKSL